MRTVVTAAAQMGPNQRSDTRTDIVSRMMMLMKEASAQGADFIVYPELCLTTFFPRWYVENIEECDHWFESEMPSAETQPLFALAQSLQMSFTFGFAEKTHDGRRFNTSIQVESSGKIVGKYRKIHLPGHDQFDPDRTFQHLEKRYFEPGDLGFPVYRTLGGLFGMCICNDRRWPETFRSMGLQGVEMVTLGYNTPSSNSQKPEETDEKRMFHSNLVMQAGAYQNSCWVVGVAKAGDEDGHPMIGGSVIINPDGEICVSAATDGDELLVYPCDLDACHFGKQTVFDFGRHRRIEHYQRITSQVGVLTPPDT